MINQENQLYAKPRIARMSQLQKMIGLAPSTIYRLIAQGRFPKPFKICGGRAAGWKMETLEDWMRDRSEITK